MAEPKVVLWKGASGQEYPYWAYPLPGPEDFTLPGNYIFARVGDLVPWIPVFIGHGTLAALTTDKPELVNAIFAKGATHVHTHRNRRANVAESESVDILAQHPVAYAPTGVHGQLLQPDFSEEDVELRKPPLPVITGRSIRPSFADEEAAKVSRQVIQPDFDENDEVLG